MSGTPTESGPAVVDYAPRALAPGLRLHRMPLVWVALGVPGLFLVWLVFLSPSL